MHLSHAEIRVPCSLGFRGQNMAREAVGFPHGAHPRCSSPLHPLIPSLLSFLSLVFIFLHLCYKRKKEQRGGILEISDFEREISPLKTLSRASVLHFHHNTCLGDVFRRNWQSRGPVVLRIETNLHQALLHGRSIKFHPFSSSNVFHPFPTLSIFSLYSLLFTTCPDLIFPLHSFTNPPSSHLLST